MNVWNASTSYRSRSDEVSFQQSYQSQDYKSYRIIIRGKVFAASQDANMILQTSLAFIQEFEKVTFDDSPGQFSIRVITADGRGRVIIDKVDSYRAEEALNALYTRMIQFWNEGT